LTLEHKREIANRNLKNTIRSIIAEEMGVDVERVIACEDFAEMGLDSLMGMIIIATLREATGLSISHDFFLLNPSLKQLERSLSLILDFKGLFQQ
jgi:acyl carrier protein